MQHTTTCFHQAKKQSGPVAARQECAHLYPYTIAQWVRSTGEDTTSAMM